MRWLEELFLKLARRCGNRRDAVAFSHKAWERMAEGRLEPAIYYGEAAVAADPSYPHGHRVLGLAYLRTGDPARARETFERGVRMAQEDATLFAALGDLERELKRYAAAEAWYGRALALEPRDAELLLSYGLALVGQGKFQDGEKLLEEAYVLMPGDVRIQRALGQVRVKLQKWQEALPLLLEVVKREPTDAFVHYSLAYALAGMGNWHASLEEARKAVDLQPDNDQYRRLHEELVRAVEARKRAEPPA